MKQALVNKWGEESESVGKMFNAQVLFNTSQDIPQLEYGIGILNSSQQFFSYKQLEAKNRS